MFWKPGADAPVLRQKDTGTNETTNFIYNANKNCSLSAQRQKLPIFNYRNNFLYSVESNSVTVVVGETGSGKSTQIPQYLSEANWASNGMMIAVTEPRRNATITLASRVADEMGCHLGSEVGYQIRFENAVSESTKIMYCTDGSLLREIMADPLLTKYAVIVVDEVHERNINTDLLIALLRKIIKQRSDLKIVLTSATTDAEKLKKFFCSRVQGDSASKITCSILSVEGRNFPVQINFAVSPVPDYLKASIDLSISLHENRPQGDILVFLTSQDEVLSAVKDCREEVRKLVKPKQNVKVLPFYGSLPTEEQIKVFDTTQTGQKTRRIIFCTNIAESSVTIPRIIYVIDCGFSRYKTFNANSGLEIVIKSQISRASAVQRAGRAGRLGHGEAFRLYTESSFEKMLMETPPDITRSNLADVVLKLKAIGISNIVKFNFLTPPPSKHLCKTLEVLHALNAIDDKADLTAIGFVLVEFPIDPMLTVCLLESDKYGCSEEILTIVAMLQVNNVFIKSQRSGKTVKQMKFKFAAKEGDMITYLNIFRFFVENNKSRSVCKEHLLNYDVLCKADNILKRLKSFYKRYGKELSSTDDDATIRKCLLSGLFVNAAYYHHTGVYKTFRDHFNLSIHPSSVLVSERPKYVIFNEVLGSSQNYMKDITVIESEWLLEVASHYYVNKFETS